MQTLQGMENVLGVELWRKIYLHFEICSCPTFWLWDFISWIQLGGCLMLLFPNCALGRFYFWIRFYVSFKILWGDIMHIYKNFATHRKSRGISIENKTWQEFVYFITFWVVCYFLCIRIENSWLQTFD